MRLRMRHVALAVLLVSAVFDVGVAASTPEQPASIVPDGLARGWYARIDTSRGSILVRLLPEQAPQSVAHFAALAEGRLDRVDPLTGEAHNRPYFDGREVELAEAGQRIEIGEGTSGAGPYVPPEGHGPVTFDAPGRLGLTRSGRGRISALRFFATASGLPWLNGSHPCFGEVVDGLDVIREISQVKTYSNGRPIEAVTVESVRIVAVGHPPPLPAPEVYRPVAPKFELREPLPNTDGGPRGPRQP